MRLTRADLKRLGLDHLAALMPRKVRPVPIPAAERVRYPGYPGRWIIEISGWKPTLDNELKCHPMVAHRRKRRDVHAIAMALMVQPIPRAIGKRRVALEVWNRYGSLPDASAPLKSLLDALVANGLLVDDSSEWMELTWPPTYERGPKRTVISLEDIP